MEGPLLVVDPKMPRKVEHHRDAPFNFIPTDLLRDLTGPIDLPPKLIPGICPLLAGLDPLKGEICCHNHPIQPSLVYSAKSSVTCSIPLVLGLSNHLALLTGI